MKDESLKREIRDHYEALAGGQSRVSGDSRGVSVSIGYSDKDLAAVPDEANLGLGCGNPQEAAKPKRGESVLDLGSGRGLDCFLAARAVGAEGKVFGVDSSPTMIAKARQIAQKNGFSNCEFVSGDIENVPLPDGLVDLVISNCVINLSDDKRAVYAEIFRLLKPGGRLAISDITTKQDLPEAWISDPAMWKT